MAYKAEGLRRLTYGGAVGNGVGSVRSVFHYADTDAAATVEAANYFNSAAKDFVKGDIIKASLALGGTPVLKQYIVTSATGASPVTIALQTTTAG
jgi:hypothetical protein